MHRGLGEPLPHQLANAPRVHPSATPESAFQIKTMRFRLLYGISTCFQVLSPSDGQVTHVLLTRSPLLFFRWSKLRWKKEAFDLHVLGTPPAFVLSQDQTLIKVRTILRLLSSICLLAYCLLVKNVYCLELNQDALHIWFVLLCSVFKGLLHRECFPIHFWLP